MNRTGKILDRFSVHLDPEAMLGYPVPGETYVEPPVEIRKGAYDVEFIGAFTYLGGDHTMMRHIWMIGRFCAIASNVTAGVLEHPTDFVSPHPLFQYSFDWRQLDGYRARNKVTIDASAHKWFAHDNERFSKIRIGSDVWIGEGVLIRRGVTIGDGAIIASRSVVTKNVPPYAIVGGAPAQLIRYRFEPEVVEALLHLQWWAYGVSALDDVDMSNVHQAIDRIDRNIASGRAQPYQTPLVKLDGEREASLWIPDAISGRLVPTDPAPWFEEEAASA
jgi:hypothetical protein